MDLCNTPTNSISFVFCYIAQAKLDLCKNLFCGKLTYRVTGLVVLLDELLGVYLLDELLDERVSRAERDDYSRS